MTDVERREIALDAECAKAEGMYDSVWRWSWRRLEADLRAAGWDEETISLSLAQSFQTYVRDREKMLAGLRERVSGTPDARKEHDRG